MLAWGLILGLTACGGEDAEISNVSLQGRLNEGQIYYATDLKLGVPDGEVVDFGTYGPTIYYPEGQSVLTYSTKDRKTTTDTYTWADAPGEWAFEKICHSESGEMYGLVSVGTGNNGAANADTGANADNLYLCKFDLERKLVFAKSLAGQYGESGVNYSATETGLEAGNDGKVYLGNSVGIWIFEADGSFAGEVSLGNAEEALVLDFAGDAYRNLYVLYEDGATQEQYVAEIDTQAGAVTNIQQTIGLTRIDATENGLLAYNAAIVYRYDREQCALAEVFHWAECDVNGSDVYGVYLMMDGNVFVAELVQGVSRNYLVKNMVVEQKEGSQTGKIDIRIAMGDSRYSDILASSVTRFNKDNEKYNIILEDYRAESRAAGEARLSSELAAGAGPDLIDLSICDVNDLVENEYLEDLTFYLEESEALSEGDFMGNALETYRINDVLTAIPQKFSLMVMLGNSDYVGDERGWTLDEMVAFLEEHAGEQVFADPPTRDYFFRHLLNLSEGRFIDRTAGTCDFDNDLFRSMVNLAEEYPMSYTEEERNGRASDFTNLQNGSAILANTALIDLQYLQVYDAALEGKMTCIGYPDDERAGVIAYYADAFGISSNSPHKEGAWEFLEYFLKRVMAGTSGYFPTYRPSFQILVERAMAGGDNHMIGYGRDRWQYQIHASTQEEMDLMSELVEAARPVANEDWTIIRIITEVLEGYYAGEITLDAAIESIEQKVVVELTE